VYEYACEYSKFASYLDLRIRFRNAIPAREEQVPWTVPWTKSNYNRFRAYIKTHLKGALWTTENTLPLSIICTKPGSLSVCKVPSYFIRSFADIPGYSGNTLPTEHWRQNTTPYQPEANRTVQTFNLQKLLLAPSIEYLRISVVLRPWIHEYIEWPILARDIGNIVWGLCL
jgi:hypothetical protein